MTNYVAPAYFFTDGSEKVDLDSLIYSWYSIYKKIETKIIWANWEEGEKPISRIMLRLEAKKKKLIYFSIKDTGKLFDHCMLRGLIKQQRPHDLLGLPVTAYFEFRKVIAIEI